MKHILSMTMVDQLIGNAPFIYEGDFVEGVYHAYALGYSGVELHTANPEKIDIPAIKSALQETGICLTALGTGRAYVNEGLSISESDYIRRVQAIRRLKDFIGIAGEFKCMVIIGCMRGNLPHGEKLSDVLERLGESMLVLDAFARERDVTLVFEPINRYENNFLCTVGEICDFINCYGLTNTSAMLDTFHMNIEERNIKDTLSRYGEKINYVHIADSNRLYPGGGHINFPSLFQMLEACGYQGAYSAECLPLPSMENAQKEWLHHMEELLSKI